MKGIFRSRNRQQSYFEIFLECLFLFEFRKSSKNPIKKTAIAISQLMKTHLLLFPSESLLFLEKFSDFLKALLIVVFSGIDTKVDQNNHHWGHKSSSIKEIGNLFEQKQKLQQSCFWQNVILFISQSIRKDKLKMIKFSNAKNLVDPFSGFLSIPMPNQKPFYLKIFNIHFRREYVWKRRKVCRFRLLLKPIKCRKGSKKSAFVQQSQKQEYSKNRRNLKMKASYYFFQICSF